jgi:hypothetical protein
MTSGEAQHTLKTLQSLIAVLEMRSGSLTREQIQALRALRHRRSSLRALLAVRKAEKHKKIVSLDLWRDGYVLPGETIHSPVAAHSLPGA